jgi:penicillin G amidase
MKKGLRSLMIGIGIPCVIAVILWGAASAVLRASLPRTRGEVMAKGLDAAVEVLRDRYGVPHIRARTLHDLYFAQGYVTAQDRFWQMEFWRRIGSGRLSEYFGRKTLGTDVYIRTVGFRRAAEQDYAAMDPETRKAIEAYADGVNAYTLTRSPQRVSIEFRLLSLQGVPVTIEPWVPQDSITWLKLMAQDLGGNMRRELYSANVIQKIGVSLTKDFYGGFRWGEMPVTVSDNELPRTLVRESAGEAPGSVTSALLPANPDQLSALAGVPTRLAGGFGAGTPLVLGSGSGLGTNCWAIAGSRTLSGKPILADDTHLAIQMPSIWYEVDLACPAAAGGRFHVRGFSFAGVPGVVIGQNERIAWGVSNLNPDVEDLYIEKVNPENPNQYEVNGHWVDMKIHREQIRVFKEDEPVVVLARETRHGPIITDEGAFERYRGFAVNPHGEFPATLELKALSLRWTALQANATFRAILMLDHASSFAEFREALRYWDIPSQNFVYADVQGNIGYQAPGLIPIRAKGDGTLPSPGWTNDYEWKGFLPFDELPWSCNPPKGFIVSANNPVTSPSYRHFLSADFDYGYRARRIVEMIEGAKGRISPSDVQVMQADTLNLSAREVIPYLASLALKGDAARARDLLLRWDMRMDPQSAGAAVYACFWQSLLEELFKDKLTSSLWDSDSNLVNSQFMNTVYLLLKHPHHLMWDKPTTPDVREGRDDVLSLAMERAARRGIRLLGPDIDAWRWGRLHQAVFRNQSFGRSGIGLIEKIFNRGPVPTGGGMQQVVSSDWRADKPFETYWISAMRQIVDLSHPASSVSMHTTGQSGHVGSRHYDDMIESWRQVRHHPIFWDEASLQSSRPERLLLLPR